MASGSEAMQIAAAKVWIASLSLAMTELDGFDLLASAYCR
jgi:hypothetical protein